MKNAFNRKIVIFMIGIFLCIESAFIALSALVAFYYDEYDKVSLLLSTFITLVSGVIFILLGNNHSREIGKKEGFMIVSFVWIAFSFFGMLPFLLSGAIPDVTDAFFETMSGFTTTGASILKNIEILPHGLLFWRSITQWLGGLGFVVLSMAILPFVGSEVQLFSAEATGPTHDKIQPRVKDTARRLWVIYFLLTSAEVLLLSIGGMNLFDATCHSFTTLSTGGYSTKQMSIAYWASPFIQYVIIFFMFVGGVNFTLLYFSMIKGRFEKLFKNEEFKAYMAFIAVAAILISIFLIIDTDSFQLHSLEKSFRESLFQVTSVITTTGFVTTDYMKWRPISWIILIVLMLIGASAGSTSGAIKISRILLLFKNSYYEFKRRVHPKAILPVRMNGSVVSESIINSIFAFFTIYIIIILLGVVLLSLFGISLLDSTSAVIMALGNVGIALGNFGPAGSGFGEIHAVVKWVLSFLMLIGRLELFTVLLLFAPSFWKR